MWEGSKDGVLLGSSKGVLLCLGSFLGEGFGFGSVEAKGMVFG